MIWNYRILAHKNDGEVFLQIHEVYYNNDGDANGYTESPIAVGGEDLKSITWTLNKMLECRAKPILWADDKFPSECKIKYKCELCGHDSFDKPSAHNCNGRFRKRDFRWSLSYY